MDILAVISQKGGAGKTSLAVALAVAAERAGRRAAVIDVDPQATAAAWADRRDNQPPIVVSAQPARLAAVLATAAEGGVDLAVIDTPPRAEQAALAAARAATLILIPCRPAVFDLDTIAVTLDLIRLAGGGAVVAVLNGVPAQGQEQAQARDILVGMGMTVCPAVLGYRKGFPHSAAVGQGPQEYAPGSKAAEEVELVYQFVCKAFNQQGSVSQ
jgi:chromosome partitioning protein